LDEVVPSRGEIISIVSVVISQYYRIIPLFIFSENKGDLI
jgi:hypothetical protein